MSTCKGCNQPIVWAVTSAGKRIPLDPEPDPLKGRVFLKGEEATVLRRLDLIRAQIAGEELYVPHWASCPVSATFRRKGKWG